MRIWLSLLLLVGSPVWGAESRKVREKNKARAEARAAKEAPKKGVKPQAKPAAKTQAKPAAKPAAKAAPVAPAAKPAAKPVAKPEPKPAPEPAPVKEVTKPRREEPRVQHAEHTSSAESPKPERRPTKWNHRYSVLLWQESIDISNDAGRLKMLTQSQGFSWGLIHTRPFGGVRWSAIYTGDIGGGYLKGRAGIPVSETFKNQPWVSLSAGAGLSYRTSPVSWLQLLVPVTYRVISWKLSLDESDPGEDSGFSVGIGGAFVNKVTNDSQIQLGFIHQHMWEATQWLLAWQTKFD